MTERKTHTDRHRHRPSIPNVKALFDKDRAVEQLSAKEVQLTAMKSRLKHREGDFKAEVQNEEALRLEVTHAEARVRQAEGWAEAAKAKAEEAQKARTEADEKRGKVRQREMSSPRSPSSNAVMAPLWGGKMTRFDD